MDKQFRKFPISIHRPRFDDNTNDQPKIPRHIRFQISPSKSDSCEFVDNDTVDDNRHGRDIHDIVSGYEESNMHIPMKRSATKSHKKKKKRKKEEKKVVVKNEILVDQKREKNVPFYADSMPLLDISEEKNTFADLQEENVSNNDAAGSEDFWEFSKASENYMFADEIVVNDGLNLETENVADNGKIEFTKFIPSLNNGDMMTGNCIPYTRTRMTIQQKLMMGLKIDKPIKFCPFCEYKTVVKLNRHIMHMHSYIMKEPIEKNINQLLSNQSQSCKLIRINTIRDVVGQKLWQDPKIRETLYTLLNILQVELWLGNWALPNVPFVNHVAPYIKASYMNDWYENEKSEVIYDPPPSPQSIITKSTSIYSEGSEQNLNYSGHFSHNNVDNISEVVPFESLTARLRKAGLLKQLTEDHPLISLYCNEFRKIYPNNTIFMNNNSATISRVFRYVQDKCNQNGYPVYHWLVLLQKPDYIIEYFRLREKLGQATNTTIAYLKVLKHLFSHAITCFPYQDPTFPMVDGVPNYRVINGFKCTVNKLQHAFPDFNLTLFF